MNRDKEKEKDKEKDKDKDKTILEKEREREKTKERIKTLALECFEACIKYASSRISEGSKMVKLFESATVRHAVI